MAYINDPTIRDKIWALSHQADAGSGRSLETLLSGNDQLKGQEAQRLRNFYSSNCMEPSRDLDSYGRCLCIGELQSVQDDFQERVEQHETTGIPPEEARKKVADELYSLVWGPTKVPIYQLLYLATCFNTADRENIILVMRWLINEVKVPVEGRDVLGTTAIHLTLSTKPGFDPEIAQILYDAGADVNTRNRCGINAAHEATMVWEPNNQERTALAAKAIDWFLAHGGSLDIKDNDGVTARTNVSLLEKRQKQNKNMKPLFAAVERDRQRRQQLGDTACMLCAHVPSGGKKLLTCSRCKTAKYCAPPRACQKLDWPRHKVECNKPTGTITNVKSGSK
ncbi:hypothetical protein QCA50_018461 [Cerrena zonata]|uniref:MYND-type domain-containing protein n=1 Tax=Cerrena zonata TaxID=2478898 RepID=A0AAW0FHZ6_9APHY